MEVVIPPVEERDNKFVFNFFEAHYLIERRLQKVTLSKAFNQWLACIESYLDKLQKLAYTEPLLLSFLKSLQSLITVIQHSSPIDKIYQAWVALAEHPYIYSYKKRRNSCHECVFCVSSAISCLALILTYITGTLMLHSVPGIAVLVAIVAIGCVLWIANSFFNSLYDGLHWNSSKPISLTMRFIRQFFKLMQYQASIQHPQSAQDKGNEVETPSLLQNHPSHINSLF